MAHGTTSAAFFRHAQSKLANLDILVGARSTVSETEGANRQTHLQGPVVPGGPLGVERADLPVSVLWVACAPCQGIIIP